MTTSPNDEALTCPPPTPVAGTFRSSAFGSTSLTTERNSRAGRRRSGSARSRVSSMRRCRRCSAPRSWCVRPDARIPACTPPGRSPARRRARAIRGRSATRAAACRAGRLRSSCRWSAASPSCYPTTSACSTSSERQWVSTRGSRRCGGTTNTGCRPRRTASSRSRRGSSRRGHARSTSTRWSSRRENLLGLHDFAAFCRHRDGATTIRELQRLDWSRDGDVVTAHVTADAFCWSMVRSLVGALLAVGEGRREPAGAPRCLTSTRRSSDFAAAPARGLTLVGVDYPADDELAARTEVTRDVRPRVATRPGPPRSRRPG